MISIVIFAVLLATFIGVMRVADSRQKSETTTVSNGPYRTAAEVPQEPKPEPIKQYKVAVKNSQPKREWKMPTIKLRKHTKTFSYLMPVFGGLMGIGFLYDTPFLGVGLKWGTALALSVMILFFSALAIVNADSKE